MKFFAVIGDPIVHSKSPRMHNNALQILRQNAVYVKYHLKDKTKLRDIVKLFDGVNITIPFKEEAFKIADFKDDSVTCIGSANTLLYKHNQIYAYNTDYIGFLKAIDDFYNVKKVLILGAGGTAKAIAYALKTKNIQILIANRSKARLELLSDYQCCLYDDLNPNEHFDLIVNTTSAGLNNMDLPCSKDLLKNLFLNASYAFDVIYGKQTPFMKLAKQYNLQIKDGLQMLLWQGVFAYELFLDCKNTEEIFKAMELALKLP
ncbi:shikimate dehydrogenase [Campylobacter armoricus]|uniref:Shikimate dehydrogenase (NADP(+)) n=1 Tax=Campylobacter armoricus TaxID=2505970 RepID=A0A7L5HQD6_9BACT|nr:shikimate dehydrogenase [Campylobacter armoricus]QKF79424.1 shikimate dehydrogenase [Campylobacter armoricus]